MTKKEAIRILSEMDCNDPEVADVKEAVSMAVRALEVQNDDWTEIIEDDPDTFPPVDEEGFSEYVLLSFENFTLPLIGMYRVDEKGGTFCDDIDMPLNRFGLIVNAWRPMPERFKREE